MDEKQRLLNSGAVVDSEYLEKYIELINNNLNTQPEKFITQKHHIIPQHVFIRNNLIIDNSKINVINLKFGDRLLAHYYLMKSASDTSYELANANAITRMLTKSHLADFEKWIEENKILLNEVNKRRCELISLHHADVNGMHNPRATKIYTYSLTGKLLNSYSTINDCANDINWISGSLRSILSKNKFIIINNRVYSKYDTITKQEILDMLNNKQKINERKRFPREFTCELCGKKYTIQLSDKDYLTKINKHHYCYNCTKTGINTRGVPKSEKTKEKMRQAYLIRRSKK